MKNNNTTRRGHDGSGRKALRLAITLGLLALTGCHGAPSINVLGSFFPGWMFCMLAGVILLLVARGILLKIRIDEHLHPRAIVYLSFWGLSSLSLWLLFFRN